MKHLILKSFINIMKSNCMDAYLISTKDDYQREFVPHDKQYFKFITNFTGSNGIALFFIDKGIFFTDGRYLEQAKKEINCDYFEIVDISNIRKFDWKDFNEYIVSYDPRLFTEKQLQYFPLKLSPTMIELDVFIHGNNKEPITSNIYKYLKGENYPVKMNSLLNHMKNNNLDYYIMLDSSLICWLFNIRGNESGNMFNPTISIRSIISHDRILVYILNPDKNKLKPLFEIDNIEIKEESRFYYDLGKMKGNVSIDMNIASKHMMDTLQFDKLHQQTNFLYSQQMEKTQTEINSIKKIHKLESIILCELFAWLELEDEIKTEYSVCQKLVELRETNKQYVMDSFPTICGYEENSAIIHYTPDPNHSKIIGKSGIVLVDSGGQYIGGTTDTTRTISLGKPTKEQIQIYTKILMGHIDIAMLHFKDGTTGSNIDILARRYLWNDGLDYPHSTGHGVGNFLNVHEGPISINQNNTVPIKNGMVLSNEPGFYLAGKYGMRIENLLYVSKANNDGFLRFKNLIFVPYCKKMIDMSKLNKSQLKYLYQYQKQIKKLVYPYLSRYAKVWCQNNEIN